MSDIIDPYLDLILAQYGDKQKFVTFMRALLTEWRALMETYQTFAILADIDQATGMNLDVIGSLVGQPRSIPLILANVFFGFEDTPEALEHFHD